MVADAASDLSDGADAVAAEPYTGGVEAGENAGEAIASIIANTVRELRDSEARDRGSKDGEIAQALRHWRNCAARTSLPRVQ